MSHFTNISTVALSSKGHGFEFGKTHTPIERQGDVGWGIGKREALKKPEWETGLEAKKEGVAA